jgi:hypothetical protein
VNFSQVEGVARGLPLSEAKFEADKENGHENENQYQSGPGIHHRSMLTAAHDQ